MQNQFFINNREKVAAAMQAESILILFSGKASKKSADAFFPYHPNRNFYYLTGIQRDNIILVLIKTSKKTEAWLFVPAPSTNIPDAADQPTALEAMKEQSGIQSVMLQDEFSKKLSSLLRLNQIENCYLDLERLDLVEEISFAQVFARDLTLKYPSLLIKDVYPVIANMRRIKSDAEVAEIRRAIDITRRGIEKMMTVCKPGIKEYDLEAEFRYIAIKEGERDMAFDPIIAAGSNAFDGHYSDNSSTIMDHLLVLTDVGAQSHLYSADISRAFPSNGRFDDRQRQLYQLVLEGLKEVIAHTRPGFTRRETEEFGRKLMEEKLNCIGLSPEHVKGLSWYGGVNHYIGLDTHDVGLYDIPLQAGMVVAVETAVVIPEEAVAFRIEDDVLITEDGCINLSESIVREIDDIERIMTKSCKLTDEAS